MSAEAQALLDALAKRNEHAATLAMLAAPAVQVEPELLRALRLTIAGSDVSAEADLWLSDLVASRTTVAMTLRDDVRQVLLSQFDRKHLASVTAVLGRVHHGISEVLRIEEQVTLAALAGDGEQAINGLLAPLVATLELQEDQSLARWAIRAFDAAPAEVKETQSMWRLMRSSSVMRATQTTMAVEEALASMPRRAVRMRLRRDALEIEAMSTPREVISTIPAVDAANLEMADYNVIVSESQRSAFPHYEDVEALTPELMEASGNRFRPPSPEPGFDIRVPDTVPLMLEINDVNRKSRRVTLEPGETVSVPVRPRHVTVTTCNGETYAVTPELEVEDYAVVYGAEELIAWLTARDGGRVPRENVMDRFPDEWPVMRRAYIYYAGPATGRRGSFTLAGIDEAELRSELARKAEEVIFVVDGTWEGEIPAPNDLAWHGGDKELLILRDARKGAAVPMLVDALSGGATDVQGRVTANAVAHHVIRAGAGFWRTTGDFVLREPIETVAVFRLPRILLGAEMHIDHDTYHTGEQVSFQLRPGGHELAFPKQQYFRRITIRPGHNDIDLRWRWNGKWVIVAGTGRRRLSREEQLLTETVARALADHGFGLLVGRWAGIDELASKVFTDRVGLLEGNAVEAFRQYVREGDVPYFKAVRTLTVPDDYAAPLGEASAMIVIGGLGGTKEYVKRARQRNVPVFPIAATGGVASEIAGAPKSAEFVVDEVSARDIVLHIIQQL